MKYVQLFKETASLYYLFCYLLYYQIGATDVYFFHHTEQLAETCCPGALNSEDRSGSVALAPKTTSRLLF